MFRCNANKTDICMTWVCNLTIGVYDSPMVKRNCIDSVYDVCLDIMLIKLVYV